MGSTTKAFLSFFSCLNAPHANKKSPVRLPIKKEGKQASHSCRLSLGCLTGVVASVFKELFIRFCFGLYSVFGGGVMSIFEESFVRLFNSKPGPSRALNSIGMVVSRCLLNMSM